MSVARETIRCPFCKETILTGATRCKHCHADLGSKRKRPSPLANLNTFRTGFLSGVLFALIVAVLLYYQFSGS